MHEIPVLPNLIDVFDEIPRYCIRIAKPCSNFAPLSALNKAAKQEVDTLQQRIARIVEGRYD
jgi:hypothetical protein